MVSRLPFCNRRVGQLPGGMIDGSNSGAPLILLEDWSRGGGRSVIPVYQMLTSACSHINTERHGSHALVLFAAPTGIRGLQRAVCTQRLALPPPTPADTVRLPTAPITDSKRNVRFLCGNTTIGWWLGLLRINNKRRTFPANYDSRK